MMTSSAYLKKAADYKEPPFKPKQKDLFEIKSKSNNNNTTNKMVKAVHNKSREELQGIKVAELRSLVREHNLHNQIKRYSKMKKAELVEALMAHSGKGGSPAGGSKKKSAPRGSRPLVKTTDKLVPGLSKPLYKEGVRKGAAKEFEKNYGKIPKPKKKPVFIDVTGGKPRSTRGKKPDRTGDFAPEPAKPKPRRRGRPRKVLKPPKRFRE